jgi:hypothetical protein
MLLNYGVQTAKGGLTNGLRCHSSVFYHGTLDFLSFVVQATQPVLYFKEQDRKSIQSLQRRPRINMYTSLNMFGMHRLRLGKPLQDMPPPPSQSCWPSQRPSSQKLLA